MKTQTLRAHREQGLKAMRPTDSSAPRPTQDATPGLEERTTSTWLSRHQGGYAAQGPGFYVWDRNAAEVIRVAESLLAGRVVTSASARFMLIDPAEPVGGSAP